MYIWQAMCLWGRICVGTCLYHRVPSHPERAKENKSYADILRKVKANIPKQDVEGSIKKVRRTATGQLLIILNHKIGDKMGSLQCVTDVLKEEADVIDKTQEVDVEIRDIKETTSKDEVKESL